ncbi:NERD domain-containing protein/DEAD/DEAH box helicase [Pseudomonas stutzeri]|nr:NERD domain-containing protein/DEAD/DEAH box helicase [Stutzerimonas stutzeri]
MATLLTSLNSCLPRMTAGERKVARLFEQLLDDSYLCWYDVPLGARGQRPDFSLLHPLRGILLLEVKDWKLSTLLDIDRRHATLQLPSGPKRVSNPLEQVRQYCYVLSGLLQRDPQLTHPAGPNRGQLLLPWGYGVILTQISRAQFEQAGLGEVLNASQVICKDELDEKQDPEALQQRLWGMFTVSFPCDLDAQQVDRVRWHLFPELRLQSSQQSLFDEPPGPDQPPASPPDLVRIMDLQQEQLARNLGEGHRVIHGVAGSGKTMILGYRALHLARLLQAPILVLCYNKALAARLNLQMTTHGVAERVQVRSFHAWCGELLRSHAIALPRYRPGDTQYPEKLVAGTLEAVADGRLPGGRYGAILIDEGHDFQPEWFQLAVQQLDPATQSLLVLYDDAQSLYKRRRFSFSSVGIQARGRTTILRLNYRNTAEILGAAARFASEWLTEQSAEEDGIPRVPPQSVGRNGPPPQWRDCADEADELARVIAYLRERRAGLDSWGQLAVLGKTRRDNERIHRALVQAGIPACLLAQNESPEALVEDSVKILTLHASKGLEFEAVAIPFVGQMPHPRAESIEDESRVLYVGMTRSMTHLLLTASRDSAFSLRLRAILAPETQPVAEEAACR